MGRGALFVSAAVAMRVIEIWELRGGGVLVTRGSPWGSEVTGAENNLGREGNGLWATI